MNSTTEQMIEAQRGLIRQSRGLRQNWYRHWITPDALAALLKDSEEQARLLGMSGERECALRGEVERLERELAALRESYAYAEISLPAELIPARIKEPK